MRMSPIGGFDGDDVELYVEPFLGWRGWKWDAQRKRLLSLNGIPWTPGEELHAECTAGGGHPAPHIQCNCGIFSMKAPHWIDRHVHTDQREVVVGAIKIWGNIVGGKAGWRAEYAMIDSLYVPCSDAELEESDLMRFMYDIEGIKTPSYLRSTMAKEIEQEYGVPVFNHDPRDTVTVPEGWEEDLPF